MNDDPAYFHIVVGDFEFDFILTENENLLFTVAKKGDNESSVDIIADQDLDVYHT